MTQQRGQIKEMAIGTTIENGDTRLSIRTKMNDRAADLYAGIVSRAVDKPSGEQFFTVITGQSNALGVHPQTGDGTPAVTMTQNSGVKDWQAADGVSIANGDSGFAFVTANPARTTPTDFTADASLMLVGMRGGGTGHIGWFFADAMQRITGRTHNILGCYKSGTPISAWASGAEVEAELATQMTAAKTALGLSNNAPDFVIWLQGENNVLGTAGELQPEAYADAFFTFKTLAETKWAKKDYTRWLVVDIAESNSPWGGIEAIASRADPYVHFVSSVGAAHTFSVAWHYTGPGLLELGRRCAATALGLQGTPPASPVFRSLVDQYASAATPGRALATIGVDGDLKRDNRKILRGTQTTTNDTPTIVTSLNMAQGDGTLTRFGTFKAIARRTASTPDQVYIAAFEFVADYQDGTEKVSQTTLREAGTTALSAEVIVFSGTHFRVTGVAAQTWVWNWVLEYEDIEEVID